MAKGYIIYNPRTKLYYAGNNIPDTVDAKKARVLTWEQAESEHKNPLWDRIEVTDQPTDMRGRLRDKTSAERKAEPIHSGVLTYFPDALAAVARVSKAGNDKHNPGEPLHWARGKSNDQMDCVIRHSLTPNTPDADDGELELAHAAWRILAQLQLAEEKRLSEAGIMPYSRITP